MNRKERRSLGREVHWTQRADPKDPGFALIEIRLPNGGMPSASYEGASAFDRIRRFARGYLCGVRGLPIERAEDPAVEALLCDDDPGVTREMLAGSDVSKHLLEAGVEGHALRKAYGLATLSFALVLKLVRQGQQQKAIEVLKLVTPGLSDAEAEHIIGALLKVESVEADPERFDA
jgi:hypothetical protein